MYLGLRFGLQAAEGQGEEGGAKFSKVIENLVFIFYCQALQHRKWHCKFKYFIESFIIFKEAKKLTMVA